MLHRILYYQAPEQMDGGFPTIRMAWRGAFERQHLTRKPNPEKSFRITLNAREAVREYLAQLATLGIYGKAEAEVARTMLNRGIETMLDR
jgi:hypothetical protein